MEHMEAIWQRDLTMKVAQNVQNRRVKNASLKKEQTNKQTNA